MWYSNGKGRRTEIGTSAKFKLMLLNRHVNTEPDRYLPELFASAMKKQFEVFERIPWLFVLACYVLCYQFIGSNDRELAGTINF